MNKSVSQKSREPFDLKDFDSKIDNKNSEKSLTETEFDTGDEEDTVRDSFFSEKPKDTSEV